MKKYLIVIENLHRIFRLLSGRAGLRFNRGDWRNTDLKRSGRLLNVGCDSWKLP